MYGINLSIGKKIVKFKKTVSSVFYEDIGGEKDLQN